MREPSRGSRFVAWWKRIPLLLPHHLLLPLFLLPFAIRVALLRSSQRQADNWRIAAAARHARALASLAPIIQRWLRESHHTEEEEQQQPEEHERRTSAALLPVVGGLIVLEESRARRASRRHNYARPCKRVALLQAAPCRLWEAVPYPRVSNASSFVGFLLIVTVTHP